MYSVGKIPGGYVKRETKPSDRETLISRLIDRPLRPLFDDGFRNETQVVEIGRASCRERVSIYV